MDSPIQHDRPMMTADLAKLNLSDIRQNQLAHEDAAFHDWYRFVLSFPPHLIRQHFEIFDVHSKSVVLDPFCGTGTTIVEAKKRGIAAFGQEAHPMAHFASSVKTNWKVDPAVVRRAVDPVLRRYEELLTGETLGFGAHEESVLLEGCISRVPLHKLLCLRLAIDACRDEDARSLMRLLLATTAVNEASNLYFAPEVTVGKAKKDADVWANWMARLNVACDDLRSFSSKASVSTTIHRADSRSASKLENRSIDFVFTSPPYPNEKDYTRTTRLESVLLGFIRNNRELREVKHALLRSNTRNIYKADADDAYVLYDPLVDQVAEEIERRRRSENKDSGFEKLYAKVTKMYFGGMMRHFVELKPKLKPDARLCYVVGDQASFLRVHIKTGEILAEIADRAGYEVAGIEVFRTRFSTATQTQLREEVLILKNRSDVSRVPVDGRKEAAAADEQTRYDRLIVSVFDLGFDRVSNTASFTREDLQQAAQRLNIALPKNLGDILYTYRYRRGLPNEILKRAPDRKEWVIRSKGRGKYVFELAAISRFYANVAHSHVRVMDRTPDAFNRVPISDQQRLLAVIRINGLVEKFTGTDAELLGSHFRSTVKGTGQVMTDEVYLGSAGKTVYCFPVQARTHQESLSVVQIEQDMQMCAERFPRTKCRPIGAQLVEPDVVALMEFIRQGSEIRIRREEHYRLVRG